MCVILVTSLLFPEEILNADPHIYIYRLWQILPRTELRSRRRSPMILLLDAELRKRSHCLKEAESLDQLHQG